jgi:hypothetical protein
MSTDHEASERADDLVREVLQLWESFRHIEAAELPPRLESLLEKARACQEARTKADSHRYRNCLTAVVRAEEEEAMRALAEAHRAFVLGRRNTLN